MHLGLKPIKIGQFTFPNRLFLAPMVDITDLPYRLICKEAGAGYTSTEMIYVNAIVHENSATKKLMETEKKEFPKVIQITGNTLKEFKQVITYLKNYDIIDLNCGCPSVRIVGNEAGSYLLNNPNKIASIIRLLKKSGLTVTAKIRLGFKNNNVLEIAKKIEKAGADAITIHARLATHSNKIPADWKEIEKVKKTIKIPVIGNGDIDSPEKAEKMLEIADACMIARAAIGDPDIFARTIEYFKTEVIRKKSFSKNLPYLKKYISYCKKYNFNNLHRIKYVSTNFISGFQGSKKIRQQLMQSKSLDEIEKVVSSLLALN